MTRDEAMTDPRQTQYHLKHLIEVVKDKLNESDLYNGHFVRQGINIHIINEESTGEYHSFPIIPHIWLADIKAN